MIDRSNCITDDGIARLSKGLKTLVYLKDLEIIAKM